ncbi:MAG: hypothetical protein WDO56_15760 [Gammaproteobacteria bacterium]
MDRSTNTPGNGSSRPAPTTGGEGPPPDQDRMWIGKLIDHGRSNYEFHRDGHASYYVQLLVEGGQRLTLWGAGLERAIRNSRTQPQLDDHIGVRQNNLAPVSVVSRKRNADGVVVATQQFDTPRPRWIVEKLQEFDMRAAAARALRDTSLSRREAVTNHRELNDAYAILDTAQKMAEMRFGNPETREKVVSFVRETLAQTLERGENLMKPRAQAKAERTRE